MAHLDSGALVKMGPNWTRHSEEWNLIFGFSLTDNNRFNKEDLPPRIRQLLKLPDLQMEVLHVSHWVIERVVADKYSNGSRVLLAGDACHRRPPTTGKLSPDDARPRYKLTAFRSRLEYLNPGCTQHRLEIGLNHPGQSSSFAHKDLRE
jgi:hypothetical protein